MEIGTDEVEKWNFKTAAYIILLIKDSDAFILELFLECLRDHVQNVYERECTSPCP